MTPLDNGIPKPKPSEGNQRGGEGAVSITLLGNTAIIKEERETYRDENSWYCDFNRRRCKEDGSCHLQGGFLFLFLFLFFFCLKVVY